MFKKGNIPLYFQFYLKLKQEIVAGDRPPGSSILTLNELAEQTGISHGMIRKALELLEQEGLIVKKPRRGTFVRETNQKSLWVPTPSLAEIQEQMRVSQVNPLLGGFIDPPKRVMSHFGEGERILKNGRIYRSHFILVSGSDDRRRDLVDLYIPYWRYGEVPLRNLKKSPIITMAAGVEIKRIKQVTRPWFCDHYAAGYLQIPDGTPILHRTIIVYLPTGEPLSVLELLTNINAMEREITIE